MSVVGRLKAAIFNRNAIQPPFLPRPTQARNSGRAKQFWIAGCGWRPRRGD
jgi:hypothetical protein